MMLRALRRRRGLLASAVLLTWVFALFVGIAQACGWDEISGTPPGAVAERSGVPIGDHGIPPGCAQFCDSDIPLVSAPQGQDPPSGLPPPFGVHPALGLAPIAAPAFRTAPTAHPAAGVPVSIRYLRLTL